MPHIAENPPHKTQSIPPDLSIFSPDSSPLGVQHRSSMLLILLLLLFASHPSLAIVSRPAPQRASADPCWPFFLLFMNCPAVVLGLRVLAHPHTNETSEGSRALGQVIGDLWGPVKKKRKVDSGRRTLRLFAAVSFCSSSMWLILFSRCLSELLSFIYNRVKFSCASLGQLIATLQSIHVLNMSKYDPKSSKVKWELCFKSISVTSVTGASFYFYTWLCIWCWVNEHTHCVL